MYQQVSGEDQHGDAPNIYADETGIGDRSARCAEYAEELDDNKVFLLFGAGGLGERGYLALSVLLFVEVLAYSSVLYVALLLFEYLS
jgi:hypothetical protein